MAAVPGFRSLAYLRLRIVDHTRLDLLALLPRLSHGNEDVARRIILIQYSRGDRRCVLPRDLLVQVLIIVNDHRTILLIVLDHLRRTIGRGKDIDLARLLVVLGCQGKVGLIDLLGTH